MKHFIYILINRPNVMGVSHLAPWAKECKILLEMVCDFLAILSSYLIKMF